MNASCELSAAPKSVTNLPRNASSFSGLISEASLVELICFGHLQFDVSPARLFASCSNALSKGGESFYTRAPPRVNVRTRVCLALGLCESIAAGRQPHRSGGRKD